MRLTETHERWLILLVALHSFIIGVVFLVAPNWSVNFGGWDEVRPAFFIRQAGIFHLVLVVAYLIEYFRYRGVLVLVAAKSIAMAFLLLAALLDDVPWAVGLCGLGDGAMAVTVGLVHHRFVANRNLGSLGH